MYTTAAPLIVDKKGRIVMKSTIPDLNYGQSLRRRVGSIRSNLDPPTAGW